ncbi:DUF1223 domain-containing protein, partial [candidate division KSB1 bacterium]|nr:DUF1223 domain-containing protein [candidate division KSB1 bacterium]
MAKCGANYMNSQLINLEAKADGYIEGIGLDSNGYVSEGSGENIFVIRDNRIYTPQMIVNGTEEFVGSNRAKARANIESALKKSADFTLFLEKSGSKESNQLEIEYNLSKLPEDAVLNLALVERGLVQNIKRGENSGMKLHHENVVRSFSSPELKKQTGRIILKLPSSVDLDNCSIIGYVQNFSTMEILAASRVEL